MHEASDGAAESRRRAWRFVTALGTVSLFADMTYEGARSIAGAYLYHLGAGAFLVGLIGGGAEFAGYAVRWLAGRGADASERHWLIMYCGYALNMIAVPCIALANSVGPAAGLIVAERLGKGVRTPARNALIARAGSVVGHGASFGVHEFLDQLGAFAGPLVVAGLVAVVGYRAGFAVLAAPAVAALVALAFARRFESRPVTGETARRRLPAAFWAWVVFAALATAGFAHVALVTFDLAAGGLSPALVPLLVAVAMGTAGLSALVLGPLSERFGTVLLASFPIWALVGAWLLFLAAGWPRWLGAGVWGVGLGIQSAVLRAQVARTVAEGRRAEAFGILDTATGAAWFGGSALLGALYEISPGALVAGAAACELLALVWLVVVRGRLRPA